MCVVATLPLPSLSSLHSARKLHFFIINRENPRYLHKTVATGPPGGHIMSTLAETNILVKVRNPNWPILFRILDIRIHAPPHVFRPGDGPVKYQMSLHENFQN